MKPIDFPQSTKVLQRPSTMTDKECASLHVWSDGNQCVSCWKPTFKERLNILFGGKVWLGVLSGKTQPPVFVSGTRVFNKAPFGACCRAFFGSVVESITKAIRTAKQADKQKHFVAGFVIALLAGLLLGFWGGFSAGCLAGATKEWWDAKGHGTAEVMDFVFTLLGAIVGASVAVLLMMLLEVVLPSMLM